MIPPLRALLCRAVCDQTYIYMKSLSIVLLLVACLPCLSRVEASPTVNKDEQNRRIATYNPAIASLAPDDVDWQTMWQNTTLNACNTPMVQCNEQFEVVQVTLSGVVGRLDFEQLPNSVERLIISHARLFHPLPLTSLPKFLRTFKCRNVTVLEGKGGRELLKPKTDSLPSALTELVLLKCLAASAPLSEQWEKHAVYYAPDLSSFLALEVVAIDVLRSTSGDESTVVPEVATAVRQALEARGILAPPILSFPKLHIPNTVRILNLSGVQSSPTLDISAFESLVGLSLSHMTVRDVVIGVAPKLQHAVMAHLHLQQFPVGLLECPSLTHVSVTNCRLPTLSLAGAGGYTPKLRTLHQWMYLDLSRNKLTSIEWQDDLPSRLRHLDLSYNQIAGALPLSQLPPTLTHLDVSHNRLKGEVDMKLLPTQIAFFNIQMNQFSGSVDLTVLPPSIRFMYLQNNKFTGRPDVNRLPMQLRRILFGNNSWTRQLPPA